MIVLGIQLNANSTHEDYKRIMTIIRLLYIITQKVERQSATVVSVQ